MARDIILIPKISTRPDKIVLYNEISWYGKSESLKVSESDQKLPKVVEKKFHNFQVSKTAQNKIIEKVKWLYFLSKSRYIKTYSGKEIHNFKINFITLTLPSKQKHPTSVITSECFNQFLTELRQRLKLENYVWRLEFQQNGNVHYHIVTDVYTDYFFVQKLWNRILSKLGYVQEYQQKMSKISLMDYVNLYSNDGKTDFSVLAKRYAKGKSENWNQPPSVDVRCTSNKDSISFYISKYFSKQKANQTVCNELDNEENSFSLRLWFCSRSLSKLTAVTEWVENIDFNSFIAVDGSEGIKTIFHQYCTVVYFNFQKLTNYVKSFIYPYLSRYAYESGYIPAT